MEKTEKNGKCCAPHYTYVMRLALGGLLLVMGINKFSGGVSAFVDNMSAMLEGSILPLGLITAFLTIIPLIEVVLGAMILLGLYTNHAAGVAAYLFALFIIGLTSTGNPELMQAITNNFIYLYGATMLAKCGMVTRLSLDHMVCGGKCEM